MSELHVVDLSAANGNELGFSWTPSAFQKPETVRDGGVVPSPKGSTFVPRTLVDGTLPDARPFGAHGDWICEQDWDFVVYAYSNGRGRSFANEEAMRVRAGIASYDYHRIGAEQARAIREGVWDRLVAARLASPTGELRYNTPLYDLLIPPQVSPNGRRPTGIRATIANMEAEGEDYVRFPCAVFTDQIWKQIRTHELRRVLAAMYCFNDLVRYGGVDLEELRLEGDKIHVSAAFLKACGSADAVRVMCCVDYLSSRCGAANWVPVRVRTTSTRPGEKRLVYVCDGSSSPTMLLRPTMQVSAQWTEWLARQEEVR